jgi:hypothetical protein
MTAMNRVWELRKGMFRRELTEFADKSPVMRVVSAADFGPEFRALVRFDTETLVSPPGGPVGRAGPVMVGIRYHERHLSEAPIPWELVSLLHPAFVFHPNVNAGGALCLGHPPPGVPLGLILHMTWAALVFNLRVVDTVDWHGLNPRAAAFVRANREMFPLCDRGLFEAPRVPERNDP